MADALVIAATKRAQGIYVRFRSGSWFLALLSIFVVGYTTANSAIGFDPGWGLYNLILSTEASANGTLLVMQGQHFENYVREQLGVQQRTLHVIRGGLDRLVEIADAAVALVRDVATIRADQRAILRKQDEILGKLETIGAELGPRKG